MRCSVRRGTCFAARQYIREEHGMRTYTIYTQCGHCGVYHRARING
jgi:hypothetical protein